MTQIFLVGTVHQESGLATASALLDILESVRPDVIFLEIPPASFPAYDVGACSNLESRAARRYRERTGLALVPVDLPTPDESFFRDWQYMDRRITATCSEYRQLIDENAANTAKRGFAYLNSEQCRDAWSAIYQVMEIAIQRLSHDTKLPTIYEAWRRTNELRDEAMLQCIGTHCSQTSPAIGVLLVGAAHALSIAGKSRNERRTNPPRVDLWEFM
ncbi:hypothetical protein AEP_00072 [Curvibacter sp. AEP1-3]|uniref:hypothetical protein n=1 Tax=Curvibacter sp. AEP1-3 TaxID=1844971 RepID=UPI000B568C31|nr:hypothetical protein [Curvibacter sp. AEP1-3]ARV17038.1 hypothetical protein AEP_00072 [Curvibacter sp. AEP1-3]